MRQDTWTAVREAFAAMIAVAPAERAAFLESLTPEVREEVESLVDAHDSAGAFLEPVDGSHEMTPGSTIGAYRIVDKIGQGGMGVVFRAERSDGEFRREVAIKLMGGRRFTPDAERRFLFERQVLARLDHPYIVRMLDGGISDGQRYLVMELVAGEQVVAYCERHKLSAAARLRLFRDICDAICHAHQNLVIHRDIKPGNILVTVQGEVKVLDFGVAQLALPETFEVASANTFLQPLTLAYASPEQARGEPVTVATDIYSLGVLLYHLLAGENPQSPANLPLDEALHRICTVDPPRLPRQYPGDLDGLVRKALAKDVRTRYSSVSELRADVDRYLAGLPVLAQPSTLRYTIRKFVLRNRRLSAVTAALALSVLAGMGAFVWQHRVAERERALAENRFSQARRLIYTVIFDLQPKLEILPGATTMRAQLVGSTLRYLQEMEKNAGSDPAFLRELAGSYAELARVQGDMAGANVGTAEAAKSLQSALKLLRRLLEIDPRGPGALATAVNIYRQTGSQYLQRGETEPGKAYARKAADMARLLVQVQPSYENRLGLANALFATAASFRSLEDYRQALAIYESELLNKPGDPVLLRNCALVHKNISGFYYRNDREKSLEEARQAMELDSQLLALAPSDQRAMLDVAIDLSQIASAYEALGDLPRAMSFATQSVELRQKIFDANPDDARALDRLAFAVSMQAFFKADENLAAARSDLMRAETLYRRLGARTQLPDQSIGRLARVKLRLGEWEKQQGNAARACAYLRESVELFNQAKGLSQEQIDPLKARAAREEAACGKQ